jgi:LacI family transcriptional regulator
MNLKTLAKELNLSISTVSKALSDSGEISLATKKIVQKKAKALNYQANPNASSLRIQKSNTIAVIIPAIANNFFSLAINGVESLAKSKNYHVLIYQTHEDVKIEKEVAKFLMNGRVDGVLISLTRSTTTTGHLKALKDRNIPLVFFDRAAENISAPRVITNDYESAFIATEHLIKNGCTKIAFLSISEILNISNNRLNGYLDALEKHGIKYNKNFIIFCDDDKEQNKKKIAKLIDKTDRPDAIFGCVEELAIASYEVCKEKSICIPNEVKIISFSNLKTAEILSPSLSTITQPAYDIGREAASLLFRLIDKKVISKEENVNVLNSTLLIRESTQNN